METDLGFKILNIDDLEGRYKLPKYVESEFLETVKGRNLSDKDIFFLYQSWLSTRDYLMETGYLK